jgi:hypothetical protein
MMKFKFFINSFLTVEPFYYAFLSSLIRLKPFKPELLYVIYKIGDSN